VTISLKVDDTMVSEFMSQAATREYWVDDDGVERCTIISEYEAANRQKEELLKLQSIENRKAMIARMKEYNRDRSGPPFVGGFSMEDEVVPSSLGAFYEPAYRRKADKPLRVKPAVPVVFQSRAPRRFDFEA
jgi:hypothetical protein